MRPPLTQPPADWTGGRPCIHVERLCPLCLTIAICLSVRIHPSVPVDVSCHETPRLSLVPWLWALPFLTPSPIPKTLPILPVGVMGKPPYLHPHHHPQQKTTPRSPDQREGGGALITVKAAWLSFLDAWLCWLQIPLRDPSCIMTSTLLHPSPPISWSQLGHHTTATSRTSPLPGASPEPPVQPLSPICPTPAPADSQDNVHPTATCRPQTPLQLTLSLTPLPANHLQ